MLGSECHHLQQHQSVGLDERRKLAASVPERLAERPIPPSSGLLAQCAQADQQQATTISGRGRPTTIGNTTTYVGLPVIGFAVMSYTNGTLVVGSQNVLSNYGGNFVHKTSTTIQ